MDLKKFVDTFHSIACIISVEVYEDGSFGNICVEAGNEAYYASVKGFGKEFHPGRPYTDFFMRDLNFEEFCYRCAVLKQPLHAYVDSGELGLWVNMFMLPMTSDKENKAYCVYAYEASSSADFDKMTDISVSTSAYVLKTILKLSDITDFQTAMNSLIKDIRALCNARRCCIMLTDFETEDCSILCEDHTDNVSDLPIEQYTGPAFFPVVKTWPATIAGSNGVIVKNKYEMEEIRKRNPVWVASLEGAGISSVILFPLKMDDETIGYIWATNFELENAVMTKEALELTAFLLAPKISSYHLMCRLQEMSTTDILTGLMNRNAMNEKLEEIDVNKPYGIIYADVNGLKMTNDTKGHAAGDALLREAADILRREFPGKPVFRAGGDEFVIILTDISKEDFYACIERLKNISQGHPTSVLSAGGFYDNELHDLTATMQKADECMYNDKSEFYKKVPRYRTTGHK